VLEGAAIHHGNLTLNGWSFSLDSFWTVDALFYSVAVAIEGVQPFLLHLVPAILAALTILVAAFLSGKGLSSRGRAVALGTILVVLVLPSHALAFFFLQGPWHVGTVLYCLVAMAILRHNRFGWLWFVAVALLAAALLGDLQAFAIGVIPVFLAGAVASARCRSIGAGVWTAVAAPTAIVLAILIRLVALAFGTFPILESRNTDSLRQFEANFSNFVNWSGALLGIHQGAFGGPSIPRLVEAPRVLVVAAMLAAVLAALVGMLRGVARGSDSPSVGDWSWRTDDLLLLGFVGSVGVFGLLTLSDDVSYARYLDAVVIFGTILTARFLARCAAQIPIAAFASAAALGVLTIATSAVTVGVDVAAAAPPSPTAPLETFLLAHGLTVDTKGKVRIRPVVANLSGTIVAYGRNSTTKWYRGKTFSFVVFDQQPFGNVDATNIAKTFGSPANSYAVGQYTVDVWSHPLTLGPTSFS
jgi:hypothetical protein